MRDVFQYLFDDRKNIKLYSALLLVCLILAFAISKAGIIAGALFLIFIAGIPLVYFMVARPKFGIFVLLISAYMISWAIRIGIDFPLGTVLDGMQFLLILGLLIKLKNNPDWQIFRNPITIIILIWMSYNTLQLFNPTTEVRLAWVYTIRSVAVVMLMYFVFLYNIRTKEFIRLILKLWIGLALFAAIYGMKQEVIGFSPMEEAFLNSDPRIRGLLFIAGHWRKFSIFSDPVAFSYNMVVASILCIILMLEASAAWKKVLLISIALLCLIAMLSSGTRAAYVLLPAAMIILLILKFNRQVLYFSLIGGIIFGVLIFIPTSNSTIYRFQTAFKPSNDASFNVRQESQRRIQPFIRSSPMGAGLGAVSNTGKRLAPNTFLRGFAPDSGYVRVAVELGWIGLLLFCSLFFIILRTGIKYYFEIQNPELKNYCLAMILITFALHVGSYPQEAIVQFPISIYFYLVVALIPITYQIDKRERQAQINLS